MHKLKTRDDPERANKVITGRQIRDARELLNMPQPRLAERAKLKLAIITRAEATDGKPAISIANVSALQRALEAAGIEFIVENGGRPGVGLKKAPRDVRTDVAMLAWKDSQSEPEVA